MKRYMEITAVLFILILSACGGRESEIVTVETSTPEVEPTQTSTSEPLATATLSPTFSPPPSPTPTEVDCDLEGITGSLFFRADTGYQKMTSVFRICNNDVAFNISGQVDVAILWGYSVAEGKIIFEVNDSIFYSVDVDGENLQQLNTEPIRYIDADISRDGSKFIFVIRDESVDFFKTNLHVFDIPSRQFTQITDDENYEFSPEWGFDNQSVVYYSDSSSSDVELHMVDIDSGFVTRVTKVNHTPNRPQLSPDGKNIVYSYKIIFVGSGFHINKINLDGLILDTFAEDAKDPMWSQYGDKIAYVRNTGGPNFIEISDLDRTNIISYPNINYGFNGLTWSPDETYLGFIASKNDIKSIYVFNLEDEEVIKLTVGTLEPREFIWVDISD